ncbi:hypothetical protein [Nonomuraea guangzhouensis]|uniref:Uncharacterized protein n=1 Tax=Nonomuraea guangzhouensis TaxID=1291555 RepID=A0ABW4GBV8_9ACTN|nr:hypothetical protein [Nonomuraea guangzhouensis]
MADHDRDAGSRGEEEAPRDPTPGDGLGAPRSGDTATYAPPRSDSFRDFIRQKPAQIIGAGLIGLIIGGVLGGGAVAVISGIVHGHDVPRVYWQSPAWERYPGYPDCRPLPGGTYCRQQPPYVNPMPRLGPDAVPSTWPTSTPMPTMVPTGMPTPVPTMPRTGTPTPVLTPTKGG